MLGFHVSIGRVRFNVLVLGLFRILGTILHRDFQGLGFLEVPAMPGTPNVSPIHQSWANDGCGAFYPSAVWLSHS